jgi:hypothetical protein
MRCNGRSIAPFSQFGSVDIHTEHKTKAFYWIKHIVRCTKWNTAREVGINTQDVSYGSYASHIHHSSHHSSFDDPDHIWWGVSTTKLLTVQFSPVFCYFRPSFLSHTPYERHTQSTLLPSGEGPNCTPIQNRQNLVLCITAYAFRQWMGRQKIPNQSSKDSLLLSVSLWMVPNIWTLTHFQRIYYLSSFCDFVLHIVRSI